MFVLVALVIIKLQHEPLNSFVLQWAEHTHHEGVRLCGEGPILGAADADAELHGTAWRVREESLGHVAHDPAHTHTQSAHTTDMLGHMF